MAQASVEDQEDLSGNHLAVCQYVLGEKLGLLLPKFPELQGVPAVALLDQTHVLHLALEHDLNLLVLVLVEHQLSARIDEVDFACVQLDGVAIGCHLNGTLLLQGEVLVVLCSFVVEQVLDAEVFGHVLRLLEAGEKGANERAFARA